MIRKFIKIFCLINVLLLNSSCAFNNNRFLEYRDDCIFEDKLSIYSFDNANPFSKLPEALVLDETNPKDVINNAIDLNNIKLYDKAFLIAQSLVGRFGSCLEIADLFLSEFIGRNVYAEDSIIVSTPRPGDILYYSNGGLGVEHWGIYLNEEYSLQGNFNGTTIIMNGYLLNNASDPIFRRVIE